MQPHSSHSPLLSPLLAAAFPDLGRVGWGAGHTALGTWGLDILSGPGNDTVLHVEGCKANEL